MSDKKIERKKIIADLTRWDIIEASIILLHEQGKKGFTMDQVAYKAGMAKGTVYLYFKNKQTLINSIASEIFAPLEQKLAKMLNSEKSILKILKNIAIFTLYHAEENKTLLKVLNKNVFTDSNKNLNQQDSFFGRIITSISKLLYEEMKVGNIKAINSNKTAKLFIVSLNALISQRIQSDQIDSVDEDVEELMALFSSRIKKTD